jgi:putative ABC transport system permease protein
MISRLASAEAITAGVLGVVVGIAAASVAGHLAFGSVSLGATTAQTVTWFAVAVVGGLGLAFIAIALPARRDTRALTVHAAQAEIGSTAKPIWARLGVDFVLLAAAGLVYWQVVKSGYKVVLAPEGVPTISVSYVSFLAPLLLWAGAALLAWRIANAILARGRTMLAKASEPMAHELSTVVAASMSRQRRLLSRGLLIVALTGSFAVSTAVFNSTFAAQALVDAQLTNGADVTVTTTAAAGLNPEAVAGIASLPGVAAAQSMQHRFAYVGNDLQDLYGINPATIDHATPMSNAFFGNGNAQQTLATLAARPDAVLVSDETVHDFQLQPGDLLRLRLQTAADNAYHVIPFHYVGVAREFPTAPHDSFLVANAAYVAKATGSPAVQTLLVRTSQSPPVVAARIRTALGPASGATVQDVQTALRVTLSSLPAIDLSGLTRLELGFAFLFAAGASGLILALGLSERRRMFAIASALGAGTRQLAAFVWSEALFVTVGGALLGIVSGWLLASMIVKILTGVFDPPPQHLFVPWAYLAGLAVVTAAAIAGVGIGAIRATKQPAIEIVRDL